MLQDLQLEALWFLAQLITLRYSIIYNPIYYIMLQYIFNYDFHYNVTAVTLCFELFYNNFSI